MIVVLTASVIPPRGQDALALLGVFEQAQRGRFKLRVAGGRASEARVAMDAWLATLNNAAALVERCRQVLRAGARAPDYALNEPTLVLDNERFEAWPAGWANGARRPLDDETRRFFEQPLSVLVENSRYDFGYLKKVVPPDWRARLDRAIDARALIPDHCGGLPELRKRVEEVLAPSVTGALRAWALFDSDAVAPGCLSREAKSTAEVLSAAGVSHHVLRRRAIENYLTRRMLFDWAKRENNLAASRLSWVQAYLGLTPEQRWFFPMKSGLKRQDIRTLEGDALYGAMLNEKASPLWESAPHQERRPETLLAALWLDDDPAAFDPDPSDAPLLEELDLLFQSLFASM